MLCRALTCSITLYPNILDRILHTRLYFCELVASLNPPFSNAMLILGHHLPCAIIVGCSIVVAVELRKLVRTRPANVAIRAGPNKIAPRAAGGASSNAGQKPTTSDADAAGQIKMAAVSSISTTIHHINVQPINRNDLDASSSIISQSEVLSGATANDKKDAKKSGVVKATAEGEQGEKTGLSREARERRTFVTLAYIVAFYVICWVPFHIVYDISFISPSLVPAEAFTVTFWMTYVNSTINPFLYAFTSKDVRATMWRLITCRQFKCGR